MSHCDCSPTTAHGVKNDVDGIGGGVDDSFKECFWFLRRETKSLAGLGVDWTDISPKVLQGLTLALVQVYLPTDSACLVLREDEPAFGIKLFHLLKRHLPAVRRGVEPLVWIGQVRARVRAREVGAGFRNLDSGRD